MNITHIRISKDILSVQREMRDGGCHDIFRAVNPTAILKKWFKIAKKKRLAGKPSLAEIRTATSWHDISRTE